MILYAFLALLAIVVILASVSIEAEHAPDQNIWRGFLIGGGSTVFAGCLWVQPAGFSTLLVAIAAVVVVAGGLAYGLAKLLH
jgi:hypothetical protein